jgi:hypothetical protein
MAQTASIDEVAFTFNYVLLAEVSNHSRHPRATVPELRSILRPTDTADHEPDSHVSHWWEAQLLHYGLRPSKTKAVAKTRLLDALNQGTLAVPRDIVKLEAELKKQWAKKEREAKAELKKGQSATTKTKATKSATQASVAKVSKRKAPQDEDAPASKPAKKAKASTNEQKTPKPKTSSTKTTSAKSKVPSATPAKSKPSSTKGKARDNSTTQSSATTTNHPRTKKTARRSGGFLPPGRDAFIAGGSSSTGNPSRSRQTARRGGGFLPSKWEDYDDDSLSERFNNQDQPIESYDEDEDEDDVEDDKYSVPDQTPPRPQPLGLLNGRYEISCPDLEDWGYSSPDFSLILTLDGTFLWGAYDLGMFEGILRIPERPYAASTERFDFTWRGRENGEGETSFGPGNEGWIQFLGGGEICGMIGCYGQAMFEGRRVSGSQTKSERDARSMRNEWDGYNQENYDRANVNRWH